MLILVIPGSASANHSVTDLQSIGPSGGNANIAATFSGASEDGTHVFFRTDESLVSADTDYSFDIYERFGTTTTLMSIGSQPGVDLDTSFVASSKDGSRVFFSTRDQLLPEDTDAGLDIYERAGGVTTLFPSNSAASALTVAADYQLFRQGSSQNGSRVFFTTAQQLSPADTDGVQDVYERLSDGSIMLVSTGPDGGNAPIPANFNAASDDGSHAFFSTAESLLSTDTDSQSDIYERTGGSTTLVSTAPGTGNGPYGATLAGISVDGSHVFFITNESLLAFPDGDGGRQDVYERSGGATKLVSYGPNSFDGPYDASYSGNSSDGAKVWFTTIEPLVSADTDSPLRQDVYERSSGSTRIVSTGGGMTESEHAYFDGASQDGSRVFFQAWLYSCAPYCQYYDAVFERASGATTRISPDPVFYANNHWYTQSVSQDGTRVFLYQGGDGTWERFNGTVTQVHGGTFQFSSADGTRVIFHHTSQVVPSDTDSSQDVYAALVDSPVTPTNYPRPASASPKRDPLVPAYKPCTGPNRTHGGALNSPSCNPPAIASDYLTVSTVGRASGFVKTKVVPDNPGTPGDEADIALTVNATDVLLKSNQTEYAGELQVQAPLRITDTYNGAAQDEPGTVSDRTMSFSVPCVSTPGPAGSACSANTSVDALYPGAVPGGKKSIWEIGQVRVYDGGPDGLASTNDNTLFLVSGVFIP